MDSANAAVGADEFGDFQTPLELAGQVCQLLKSLGITPAAVVEPTCGLGNFLIAALDGFAPAAALGVEINPAHVERLRESLRGRADAGKVKLIRDSFFTVDWPALLTALPRPVLVIGNPPWVTNAALGGKNLPHKSNFQGHVGLDAITGKSNFDISEWMLINLLELLRGGEATLAMLCKAAVARKALVHAWKNGIRVKEAEIRGIDAATFFGAAVDACLLVCTLAAESKSKDCRVYPQLDDARPSSAIGYRDGHLVADVAAYQRWKHLSGEEIYKWRSGVKHDCSKVMEFRREAGGYRNGLGELAELEDDYVFPMLKSSELANGHIDEPVRCMLVTQRSVGQDTAEIQKRAPRTWAYLLRHGDALDRRASSIYRKRPRFSVFGVGDYTFAPWKVGISGFYKRLKFAVVGNTSGKPTVLDDTAYFVACQSEREAGLIAELLNSAISREFFSAFLFWDAKRPITVDLLRRLNLMALARELGKGADLAAVQVKPKARHGQPDLFSI